MTPKLKIPGNAQVACYALCIFAGMQVSIASGGAVAHAERYDYAGYRLSQWHRNSEAIVFYTAAIKANPSDFVAHFNRGCCYLEEGGYAKALDDFNVALELHPQDAGEIYGVRAIAWYKLGRGAECRADLNRAKPRGQFTHPSIDELWVYLCESTTHPSAEDVKRSLAIVNRAVSSARTTDELGKALNRRAWFHAVRRSSTPGGNHSGNNRRLKRLPIDPVQKRGLSRYARHVLCSPWRFRSSNRNRKASDRKELERS